MFRRLNESGLSARRYHEIGDDELDNVVQTIKNETPTAGYHMVKGRLQSMGIHVQWRRVAASLHHVDSSPWASCQEPPFSVACGHKP